MITGAEEFKGRLLAAGIKDEGVHHGFKTGVHGEKLDFDVVKRGTRLWDEWADLTARLVHQTHPGPAPPALESTANGTVDLTEDVAANLDRYGNYDGAVAVIHTEKIENPDGTTFIRLTEAAKKILWLVRPTVIRKIDDAATTGSTTAYTTADLRSFGVEDITAVYTWMRQLYLPHLETAGVRYVGVIDNHELPSYPPEECRASKFCADGVPFIPYGQTRPVSPTH